MTTSTEVVMVITDSDEVGDNEEYGGGDGDR
jgi:hypothetical protein